VTALDVFAGDGDRISKLYLNNYDVTALDINKYSLDNYFDLKATKIVGDSIKLISDFNNEFDLILIDNPVGLFGEYCEHFELLDNALKALKDEGEIIFNVAINVNDYRYRWMFKPWTYTYKIIKREINRFEKYYYEKWSTRRLFFYGKKMDDYTQYWRFYYKYFEDRGYKIISGNHIKRYPGLYLFSYKLERN
jgi:hypothetical protein